MKLLGFALVLIGSSASAATHSYDLNMDLNFNGHHISSPHVSVKEGSTATVIQKTKTGESFVDIVASESTVKEHPGIMMKFTIGTIDKNGVRTVESNPQVIAEEDHQAKLFMKRLKGDRREILSLLVTAKRTTI